MDQFILSFLNPMFTDCHTEKYDDSPRKGVPCIFPFKYKDKRYNECTKDGHSKFWCSTKVDENGNHEKKWGNCADDCSNEGGGMLFYNSKSQLIFSSTLVPLSHLKNISCLGQKLRYHDEPIKVYVLLHVIAISETQWKISLKKLD